MKNNRNFLFTLFKLLSLSTVLIFFYFVYKKINYFDNDNIKKYFGLKKLNNYSNSINILFKNFKRKDVNFKENIKIIKYNEKSENVCKSDLTLVIAYYDINRVGRPKEEYFEWLNKTLKLNAPIVFFTQSKLKDKILSLFPSYKQFWIVLIEIENLPYYNELELVKSIQKNETYKKKIYAPSRVECVNDLYSIIIFSKSFFLCTASKLNPFNSSKFVWIDAGLSRFFGQFDISKELIGNRLSMSKLTILLDSNLKNHNSFVNRDYYDFLWSAKNFVKAGIIAGSADVVCRFNDELYQEWRNMLDNGVVNNEQIGIILLYFRNPNLFNPWFFETYKNDMDNFLDFLSN